MIEFGPDLRPIPNAPGYLCGQDGSVWSVKSGVLRQMRTFVRDRTGHYGVNLMVGGRMRMCSVHRLIALAWVGEPPSDAHVVMHLDDNPAHNAASNLAYGLPRDNSAQMVARGRQASGERCARSKLTGLQVRDIRERVAKGESQKGIARIYGVSPTTVTDIKLQRIWRAA